MRILLNKLYKILFFCSALPLVSMERDNVIVIPDLHLKITEWNDETADRESYEPTDEEVELIIKHLFANYNNDLQRHKDMFKYCLREVKNLENEEK